MKRRKRTKLEGGGSLGLGEFPVPAGQWASALAWICMCVKRAYRTQPCQADKKGNYQRKAGFLAGGKNQKRGIFGVDHYMHPKKLAVRGSSYSAQLEKLADVAKRIELRIASGELIESLVS